MKRLTWLVVAVVSVAVAAPALAGHKGEKCSQDAQTCLNGMTAKKDKGWMGLEYDRDASERLVVKKVIEGAPAVKAGFQPGDVLLTRNGIKLSDYEALKADKGSWKVGANVTYTVLRSGAEKSLAVTLAAMPEEVFARMVGDHMISDHMAVAATAAATEKAK